MPAPSPAPARVRYTTKAPITAAAAARAGAIRRAYAAARPAPDRGGRLTGQAEGRRERTHRPVHRQPPHRSPRSCIAAPWGESVRVVVLCLSDRIAQVGIVEVVTVTGTSREPAGETASVPVARVASRIEAELIVGMLRSNGLTAVVSADDAGGQEPQLQIQGVRVLVTPSDEAAARGLLAAADNTPS
jgi:hypothetical protein